MEYPHNRVFESSKGRSKRFVDIMPKRVTVRRDNVALFKPFRHRDPMRHETPFHEVKRVPVEELLTLEQVKIISKQKRIKVGYEKLSEIFFNTLMKVIRENWISSRFHIVLHSSGYDSRLISTAIKKLYDKTGKEWLGQVIFIEINGETESFERIMEIQGWGESQYIAYNIDAPSGERCAPSFEFKEAWKRLNGMSSFPFNYFWEPIEWLQEKGIAPIDGETQCFSGVGTMAMIARDENIEHFRKWHYCDGTSMPLKGDWVLPFRDMNMVRMMMNYDPVHSSYSRETILDYIAPELSVVPRRQAGWERLSERLYNKVKKDYFSSWYGSKVRPDINPTPQIGYNIWWGYWCLASFCDHLLKKGHKINPD